MKGSPIDPTIWLINQVSWLPLAVLVVMPALPLLAQESVPDKPYSESHGKNERQAVGTYKANLKNYSHDSNVLVLPGLVANKKTKRVEVLVESTGANQGSPCEFTIIDQTSDHGYEALLVSYAKPSDVHRALRFIGREPGEPFDPAALRFWAKGEPFILSIVRTNEPPIRLEKLLVGRRTGKTLPEEGFLFTGSKMVPAIGDPRKKVYAADEFQPKSIVSLFNSTYSVLEVPYRAPKEEVYQNTIVNPEHELPKGALLTLVIEPANKDESKRVKDLVLQVRTANTPTDKPLTGIERLASLSLQLKDAATVLNGEPSMISVVETLASLDRKRHDHYLTVSFGDDVQLGQAQALAKILSTIDSEQGIRIDPPPAGELYYGAFTPDQQLLDREARIYHPWELALTEEEGHVSGKLLLVNSVWKKGASASELEVTELPLSGPKDLRKELDAESERAVKAGTMVKPPVIMVFAPSTLRYGQLANFLELALPTHNMIHVYVDEPMAPIPKRKL